MTDNNNQLVKVEQFGAIETRTNAETSAIALAAQVKANIEAACIMAERHPRSMLNVRGRMLEECKRPGFAEAAIYSLPRGEKTISGFTIRFAEAALRYMTNMSASSNVVYDDDEKTLVTVTVRDYEGNTAIESTVSVPKRIEKKYLKRGEKPISSRVNSSGETVFLVPATDDEVAQKTNSLVSKAMRNAILRMLPGDIADECEEAIADTKKKRDAADPMAAVKRVMDAFAAIRVLPESISMYLGHDATDISPKELDELRGVYRAISDGDISWSEALEAKRGEPAADSPDEKKRNDAVAAALDKAKASMKKKPTEPPSNTNGAA